MNATQQASGRFSDTRSTRASVIVFVFFLALGVSYIVLTKSLGFPTPLTITGPLVIILAYAVVLSVARYVRLRDDQAGDNLYYLGFLYTLTSLGVSLWQFSALGGADAIVANFGIAVSSTILGVALRVIFSQMRRDPLEVERTARLELAEAARRVRQELDTTVFEFSSFRRATQQSLSEGMTEVREQIEFASRNVVEALEELPERSAAPLVDASRQIGETLGGLSKTLVTGLNQSAATLDESTSLLRSAATETTDVLRRFEDHLKAMQMPDGIIEIKLEPTIRSLTKALTNFSERLGAQVNQLQSAVSKVGDTIETVNTRSKAASEIQNQNLERVAALLSSNEEALRKFFDQLVTNQLRPQESEDNVVKVSRPWWARG
jgi:hypothetical protein